MPLVDSAAVLPDVRSGGHCPVLVTLHLAGPVSICWQRPRPRLPVLLQLSSADLRTSRDWEQLIDKWADSPPGRAALSPLPSLGLDSLSRTLLAALQHLVLLAGGWQMRPPTRRSAYDSTTTRCLRRQVALLHRLQSRVQQSTLVASPGSWPYSWISLVNSLLKLGLELPPTSVSALLSSIRSVSHDLQDRLRAELRTMRQERHQRWKATLPQLWKEKPRVIYHWLHASGSPWGSTPILDASGQQCLTVQAVDAAVKGYWVDTVLRHHAAVDEDACWAAFSLSQFGPHIPTV